MNPVLVKVTEFNSANNRPEKWTITPVQKSYPGWAVNARELGSSQINNKAEGGWWWCSFGVWDLTFELRLARIN